MKSNFLSKAKWYVLAFIMLAVMLSVSLSFCAWDTLSVKSRMNGGSGDYGQVVYTYTDRNANQKLDNGDLITGFGEFNLIVVETYSDRYMVVTEGVADNSVYSAAGSSEYMTSDIRARLNSVYSQKYNTTEQGLIVSRADLGGDKLWLMSLEEAQSGFFASETNRISPTWWVLRTPYTYLEPNDRVGLVEYFGQFNASPGDDFPYVRNNYRFSMYLKK